jgi:hypothetical protein
MESKRLWQNFFRKRTKEDEVELHVSGATVRNKGPFSELDVPRNESGMTTDMVEEWVRPFYLCGLSNASDETILSFASASNKMNAEIVSTLLGEFNWRPRLVGSLFAAINDYTEMDDIIGRHLVKSEVCYVGKGYCLALATFSTERSKAYLTDYLEYYLQQKDLWFDQADAFCALEYIDKGAALNFIEKWDNFVSNKPNWNLDNTRRRFLKEMIALDRIKQISNLV